MVIPDIVFLISILEYWDSIRPSSTENESETSINENVINQLHMKLKDEAEQLKNEKLKNEKLEQENLQLQAIKNKMGSMNCKFKFVTTILVSLTAIMIAIIIWLLVFKDQLGKLEIANQRLEMEKQNCDNDLKDIQTELQSSDRENQKYRNDLQEKQKELQASEKQYKTYRDCE